MNPSYKTDRIEEVYFEKGQENNSRRILWRSPFIWDETGNKIVGYRNSNADTSINTAWAGKVDDEALEVVSDVNPDSKYYAEVHNNGYGKISKVKLHLKPEQKI